MNFDIEQHKIFELIKTYFGVTESEKVINIFRRLKENGMMLCGGAIISTFTGDKVNDLDFYVKTPSKLKEAELFIGEFFKAVNSSNNAITFKRKSENSNRVYIVQIIRKFTGDAEEIFDKFDFTVTQGAYDFDMDRFEFGQRFFQDLAKKRLVYLGKSQHPICAMYRTKKYQERGYKVPGSTIMHIALGIVRLEITTYKQLKEQLMGIDTMYLQNLLSKDKYDDSLPVNFGEFLRDAFERLDGVPGDEDDEVMYPQENQ